jgi:hypothetical protein
MSAWHNFVMRSLLCPPLRMILSQRFGWNCVTQLLNKKKAKNATLPLLPLELTPPLTLAC